MLVYDGECSFCSRVVQFVLRHERRSDLFFVPRASPRGGELRRQHGLEQVESLLWIEDGRAYIEWEAVAHVAGYVGGIHGALARAASLLPAALLNFGYRIVARLRKRLAGRPRQCLLLTLAQKPRFLA
jgi:predicted DCC family thiol-disulfide oxidoreductase YuxK